MKRWPTNALEEFVEERNDRLGQDSTTIYSVTKESGFVRSLDLFDKQVFSADMSSYKRVGFGELAYNPSRINVGSIAICEDKNGGAVSPMYVIVRCKPGLLPRYLLHFLKSEAGLQQIRHRCEGAVRFQLKFRDLCAIPILAAPLTEQERIVKLLDEADDLRELRDQAETLTADFIPALFHVMFGDASSSCQTMTIEDAVERFIDYRGKTPVKTSSGVPLVTARVVKGGRILPASEFVPEATYDDWMKRGLPRLGDVLFTTEAPLGEVAIVDNARIALAQRILLMRPRPALLDSRYFMTALKLPFVWRQIEERATVTTVRGIRQAELRKVRIPVPALPAQQEFAKRVTDIRELQTEQRSSRLRLDEFFQSLLHIAFRGEL